MKNLLRLFGIIALVAVIGFSMMACGGGDGGDGKIDPTVTWPTGLTATVGQILTEVSITGGDGNGVFSWTNPNADVGVEGEQSHNMTFTPTDTTTYKTLNNNVTVTVISLFNETDGAANIGRTGPGGGKIFYYNENGFTVYMVDPSQNYTAHYLEAAPANASDYSYWCSCWSTWGNTNGCQKDGGVSGMTNILGDTNTNIPSQSILDTIGQGRKNTALILLNTNHTSDTKYDNAAKACDEYSNNGKSDWFLPRSLSDLPQICHFSQTNSSSFVKNLVKNRTISSIFYQSPTDS